jgi:Na+-driven multidrug efflux pump
MSIPRAQKAALVGLSLAFCVGGFTTVLLLALHKWVPLLFIDGSDRKLLELSGGIMLIASFAIFGDAVQTIAGGERCVTI